ncbi:MAG TPA: hypothetical protein VHY21_07105 [Pseudonocardiaceae bacterium]|nr:hypothetical protein [Pseudonocardiaceae bacterium]
MGGPAAGIERPAQDRGRGRATTYLALLALAITLLGAASGLGAALIWPKTYGARAEILYSPSQAQQGGDPLALDPQLSTQLVILKSPTVLGPIAQKQGRQFDDLNNDISVQILDNSDVIQVEAHGPTKAAAMQTLQAVMGSYLALAAQPTGAARDLATQLMDAHTNTSQLQTRVQQLTTAVLAKTATQASLNDARATLTASQDQEKAIQASIDQLNLTGQTGPNAQSLTQPYALPGPVFPQPLIAAGIGALVGAIPAGAVVALTVLRRTKPQGPK